MNHQNRGFGFQPHCQFKINFPNGAHMLLDSLNEQQKIAAEIIQGPVMVFAGAGSGKTRTLTYRIANMMASSIDPRHILAITFTNKATNEMRERLQQLVGPHASLLTISTFHSLCASILRKEIGVLGYSNRFSILDDEDQLKVIGEVIEEAKMNKKIFTPKHMRKKINWCKCFDLNRTFPP
jgi:DNA helicase-2/ATP-dependent DNA helicase PcrA